VRVAGFADAGSIAWMLSAGDATGARYSTELARLAELLALPPGEDHFLLVAERAGEVVAVAGAGGARDDADKGSAELFEAAYAPGAGEELRRVIEEVVLICARAGYDRLLLAGELSPFVDPARLASPWSDAAGSDALGPDAAGADRAGPHPASSDTVGLGPNGQEASHPDARRIALPLR
jgi:hypothetical protein